MIEIVERATCPTCGGTPKSIDYIRMHGSCATCQEDGTVPRVLVTFADAAALRMAIHGSLESATYQTETWTGSPEFPPPVIHQSKMINLDKADVAVLAALGVSDDQS